MEGLNSLKEVENNNQNEDNEVIEEDEELSYNNTNIEKEIEIEDKYWPSYFIKNFVYLICNNYKCRFRGNLRKYFFMNQFPRQQGSVKMKIIKLFIIDEKIVQKYKKL